MAYGLKIKQWLQQLEQKALPSFAHTTRKIASLAQEEESSANDLAKVILQDSTMSSRVLRLVNSAVYNPGGRQIDTVSYAIVVLGLEKVRNMAITVSFLEDLLNGSPLWHVQQETAIAYQAATHVKRLAEHHGVQDTESLYIAALFKRLGQVMYWCFPDSRGADLKSACDGVLSSAEVEKDVLGFTLAELTQALIDKWRLSSLLEQQGRAQGKDNWQKDCLAQAYELTLGVRKGWNSPEARRALDRCAKSMNMTTEEVEAWARKGFAVAASGLQALNIRASVLEQIPPPLGNSNCPNAAPRLSAEQQKTRLLRQLTHMLSGPIEIQRVLLATLEGISTALHCDQTFILLHKGAKRELVLRLNLGVDTEQTAQRLLSFLTLPGAFGMRHLMHNCNAFFCSPTAQNYQPSPEERILSPNFLCFPLQSQDKILGYIFAVRAVNQKPLTATDFEDFCHFCDHANIAFRLAFTESRTQTEAKAQ